MRIIKTFYVEPMGKPRMTQADRWRKRDCVERYWKFKEQIEKQSNGFVMPESNYHLIFYISMPKSWSKKKSVAMLLKPHQQKPDKDNLEKALLDSLCEDDAYIWDGRVTKYWAIEGKIEIYYNISDENQ